MIFARSRRSANQIGAPVTKSGRYPRDGVIARGRSLGWRLFGGKFRRQSLSAAWPEKDRPADSRSPGPQESSEADYVIVASNTGFRLAVWRQPISKASE